MTWENRLEEIQAALREALGDDLSVFIDAYPEETSLDLDWGALEDAHERLAQDVQSRPDPMLDLLTEALRTIDEDTPMGRARIRVINPPDDNTHSVGGFSPSSYVDRLLGLEGQVTKRTIVQPKLDVAVCRCSYCGEEHHVDQPPFGKRRDPRRCENDNCTKPPEFPASFSVDYDRSQWTDYQKIRLQQPPEEATGETDNFDVHVTGDLTGTDPIEGGSRVTVTGRYVPVEKKGLVNYDQTMIASGLEAEGAAYEDINTAAYADRIEEISENDPRETLIEAFAPGLEGYDRIKAATVLQLFGGWPRTSNDGNYHRGDSHILIIGDPGVGKTVLLRAAYDISPRAALTDGTGSSAAGLTATVTKDDFGDGDWTIEAGTLVRAHGGIAAIDELDKGDSSDLDALHTALESQEVHVSKAGKNASLPARTAILGAGNPTGGHFDPTENFAEQVELQSPLLSRFDLIFTMRERYEEGKIRTVADTMVEGRDAAGRLRRGEELPDHLAHLVEPKIEPEVFQAYIAQAKELKPIAPQDVKDAMKNWYTELKTTLPDRYTAAEEDGGTGPPIPVTARKLDACYRLAEASARMRHSEEITMEDLEFVTPFIKKSLADIGIAPRDGSAFGSVGNVNTADIGI